MTSSNATGVSVEISDSHSSVEARVSDHRENSIELFGALGRPEQEQLAIDAWSIGLRALANARAQADEGRLKDIGQALVSDVDRRLKEHLQCQQQTIDGVLRTFFDPRDGKVAQRLSEFLADSGVLARLLERFLGPKNSVLVETLARQVGESSPLVKRLSTTDSESIVKVMEAEMRKVLGDNQSALLRELNPLTNGGTLALFISQLRQEIAAGDASREKQLARALAALNPSDETSLISKLARDMTHARETVLAAVNPSKAGSPLALLKTSLTELLTQQGAAHADLLRAQAERQEQLEKQVREALVRLDSRREVERKSPVGGIDFESAVVDFVSRTLANGPYTVEETGTQAGLLGRSKKGDMVVTFTDESAFAGSRVVIEAKREAGMSVHSALGELDKGRKNRDACAGVLVMARSHAVATFPLLSRHGSNVLVIWDKDDAGSDAFFSAALLLGLGLATRERRDAADGDLEALTGLAGRLDAELQRLSKVSKASESIRRNAEFISDEVRKADKVLRGLVEDAASSLRALKIELNDEEEERRTPIALPPRASNE